MWPLHPVHHYIHVITPCLVSCLLSGILVTDLFSLFSFLCFFNFLSRTRTRGVDRCRRKITALRGDTVGITLRSDCFLLSGSSTLTSQLG